MKKTIENFFDLDEFQHLKQDMQRRFIKPILVSNTPMHQLAYYYSHIQYRTLLYYRLSTVCKLSALKHFFYKKYLQNSQLSGLEIMTTKLGGGLIMPHWGRIILNARNIGSNLYVFHNVTIGNDYKTGKPSIGNNVFIGTGSVILGEINIGNNVVIGACSFVNKDIPSNSLVVGNPANVIKKIDENYIVEMLGY